MKFPQFPQFNVLKGGALKKPPKINSPNTTVELPPKKEIVSKNENSYEITKYNFERFLGERSKPTTESGSTTFISITLEMLENILSEEQLNNLRKKLSEKPLINLACGTMPERFIRSELDNLNIKPTQYVSLDKYYIPMKQENSDSIHIESDLIDGLKSQPENSGNIMIGGFDREVAYPLNTYHDVYREELIKEIYRVIPVGGYLIETDSFFKFNVINKKQLEEKGLEVIYDFENKDVLYKDIKSGVIYSINKHPEILTTKMVEIRRILNEISQEKNITDFGFKKVDNLKDDTYSMGVYQKI